MKRIRRHIPDTLNFGVKITDMGIPMDQYYSSIFFKKRNKYGAIGIEIEDIHFDSMSEYIRWKILCQREKEGIISDLKRQICFEFPTKKSKHKYIADFSYITQDGREIIEDVKSPSLRYSPRFQKNMALMKAIGKKITIVSPKTLYFFC